MLRFRSIIVYTTSLVVVAIVGCGNQATVASLQPTLNGYNEEFYKSVPNSRGVVLSVAKIGSGGFSVTLKAGVHDLNLVSPELHYSLRVRFFDGQGALVDPETLIALTLPPYTGGVSKLAPGQELNVEVSRDELVRLYGGLEKVKFVAITYQPSEFAMQGLDVNLVDLRQRPLWSNAVPW